MARYRVTIPGGWSGRRAGVVFQHGVGLLVDDGTPETTNALAFFRRRFIVEDLDQPAPQPVLRPAELVEDQADEDTPEE